MMYLNSLPTERTIEAFYLTETYDVFKLRCLNGFRINY